jgi:site-specific recombinase XerD
VQDERLRRVSVDFRGAYAKNSLIALRSDFRGWRAYCKRTGTVELPVTAASLRAFVHDQVFGDTPKARATIERYIDTLKTANFLLSLPDPTDDQEFWLFWKALKNTKLSAEQTQRRGISLEEVRAIISHLDLTKVMDLRDAALLSVAFDSAARRSELVALEIEDLRPSEVPGAALIRIGRSKTDRENKGSIQYLSPESFDLVRAWLNRSGLTEGALFRSVKNHVVNASSKPLPPQQVWRIFKRLAGLIGVEATLIGGHSTRVGVAQEMLAANVTLPEIMRVGRWKTERMVIQYGRNLQAERGAMARIRAEPKR